MERAVVKAVVIEELDRLSDVESFDESAVLSDDLGLDSLDAVDLVLGLEKKLKIGIPSNDETDSLKGWTVEQLIDYIVYVIPNVKGRG